MKNEGIEVERMTLPELQEEKRRLIRRLISNDATWRDAKRFKQFCDAIRYLLEMKNWAIDMNRGKASEHQVSNRMGALGNGNGAEAPAPLSDNVLMSGEPK